MELMDIYDKDSNPTGAVKEKGAPLADGEYIMAVGMWIVDKSGRILLTKRSMEKRFAPGKWENTSGHVRAGESCLHAILRELKEETGIAVTERQVTLLGSACSGHYLGRNYGVRLDVPLEEVKFQEGETCGAKWVSFEEFVEMAKEGALSPSLLPHLQGYKRAFLEFIGRPGSTALDFLRGAFMEYRAATTDDVETLVELRKQLVAACGAPAQDVDAELRDYFQKKLTDGSLVEWLGIENGRAVATAAIVFYDFIPSDTNKSGVRGYITNMYTAPEHRGKGVATCLLGKLAEEAKARGVKRLWLHAAEMGGPVYVKFGFHEADGFFELTI